MKERAGVTFRISVESEDPGVSAHFRFDHPLDRTGKRLDISVVNFYPEGRVSHRSSTKNSEHNKSESLHQCFSWRYYQLKVMPFYSKFWDDLVG